MPNYYDIAFGPHEVAHQERHNSAQRYEVMAGQPGPDGLGLAEIEFLADRDSFYIASVGSDGWPYVQHRGGPRGFVTVSPDARQIAWAERAGNRQYITAGHLDADGRVSLIAVDYPARRRLKIYGRARYDTAPSPEKLAGLGIDGPMDALLTVTVEAFDWNCPKFITPRFTADEVRAAAEPLQNRIAALERQVESLRQHQA
ncbi:pyridoxamine 5'-phosphate oxidase family protein [Williamsia maris]|uniref:Pyridoxamine 5'-phosphate oxidase N-terminal domain-containing protein n=1 Tax=Williamsia maris TaxID=72806 RepID=A0ABT1HE38_9NOCA|nr:pyridoxamine 5'-phosphate oxidase family protein [Williamsia maris]MCP2175961.1 hypothetical protein [Williamsia maris]